jgi:type IV secretion system protein VirB9
MTHRLGLAAALLLVPASAFAADNRIQTVAYDPDDVVKIVGRPGVQSTIEFASDERIENVAVGNSASWQITPNRRASALFLKPLARATSTNMTVITDQRVYMFDLVARASASAPVYALRFRYPNEKLKPAQPARLEEAALPTTSFTPAQLNFGWRMKGHKRLLPDRVFDDGASLYLSWTGDIPLPAILTLASDGREGPINYRTAGDYIVIDAVPANLVLRQGKMMARLWRTAPVIRQAPVPQAVPPVATIAQAPRERPFVAKAAVTTQFPAVVSAAAAQLRGTDVRMLLTDKLSEGGDAQ